MIETVVERLPPVKAKASYIVELAPDGVQLLLRHLERGLLVAQRTLRATALPYGWYTVVGRDVVHRYEPEAVLVDVRRHQLSARSRTREFRDALARLARAAGGRPDPIDDVAGGFSIETKRKPKLAALRKQFRDAPFVIAEGWHWPLVVTSADSPLDALDAWFPHLHDLFGELDRACGLATIEQLGSRYTRFELARAPKQPGPLVAALASAVTEGEGEMSAKEWRRALAARKVAMWFDG